jgi:hypothetical protein
MLQARRFHRLSQHWPSEPCHGQTLVHASSGGHQAPPVFAASSSSSASSCCRSVSGWSSSNITPALAILKPRRYIAAKPFSATSTITAVSALGRRIGTVVERLYCASASKRAGADKTQHLTGQTVLLPQLPQPDWQTRSRLLPVPIVSVTGCPKERVQAISCLGAGECSKSMQGVPCSSRTVRSSTTDQRFLTMAGSSRTRSNTVATPPAISCLVICLPPPTLH